MGNKSVAVNLTADKLYHSKLLIQQQHQRADQHHQQHVAQQQVAVYSGTDTRNYYGGATAEYSPIAKSSTATFSTAASSAVTAQVSY